MHTYEVTHRVGHSARNMFDLVADIEKYPGYLPLCEDLKIVSTEERNDKRVLIAKMQVGYKLIRESFTTEVVLDPADRLILVEYLDGPFSFLENRWRFMPLTDTSCDIHFFIRYSFRSRMLERMMGGLFAKAVRKYSEAFEERANQIYGPPSMKPRAIGA
ncbi:Ribosome association toxin RatA [Methyloligella halotolerans]|uniref:Ribosome association toxin RatA n=1 Tax=Methyloligella halotolerans TaxID=1177755 RepID=A0A1E2S285_9HYPH|nr:SRPBCC family protein [Methyloligella halotolerans]ODA68445.1 Ribosome association toxin RatA [Methyloligella halotolerans]